MEEWLSMGEGGDALAGWLGTRTRRSVLRTRSAAAGSLAAQIGGMGEPLSDAFGVLVRLR